MRERLTTAGELAGGILFTIGAALIAPALGFLVGGALLMGFSMLAAR